MCEKLIYEGKTSQVYLITDEETGVPVIRKTLSNEYPTPDEIVRFYNEFNITSGLQAHGIRKVLGHGRYKRKPAVFLEYVEAQTLAKAFRGKHNDIEDFLHIAIAIAGAVHEIHQHHIIHKDINAFNILVNLQQRSVKIIDFGISSKINLKKSHLGNPERLEGSLSYISPEQTGRMNRVVDYRADLYSMGVVFYEMLTGSLPFQGSDAMQLVHAHIAQQPADIRNKNPNIPAVVTHLVARLLEKNAEDRYQSAAGVAHDLKRCLRQFTRSGDIRAFTLACNDHPGQFRIAEKLYGREQEVAAMMRAFEETSAGALKLLLVAGYSGTGKSALVHEIHKPITGKRGYFIEGKFDQFQRGVPYFAILQAFENYVNLRLTDSSEQLEHLRTQILTAVGSEGQVLTDVIPNLIHIIGPQPAVATVGGSEVQNRFNYIFSRFMRVISSAENPLVLFIDDLQWADAASLSLLKTLMSDQDNSHLLCIGAYRDNEVSDSHPLMIALGEMRETGVDTRVIEIGNLAIADITQLIADVVASTVELVTPLTQLVYSKTSGNAFFVNQFMTTLYQDSLLSFDFQQKAWRWDLDKITAMNITDNVVELMAVKIRKLPEATQQIMQRATCVGNVFHLDVLSVISGQKPIDVRKALRPALVEGLLVPQEGHYKFAHDRIQQAVYSLIPEQEKSILHLAIGRLLLKNLSDTGQETHLFDITNQWNLGWSLGSNQLLSQADQEQLAALNLRAGRKAKQASAFRPAYQYLDTGISLLPENHWQNHYAMSRDLYTQAAEVAYLNGDFELMNDKIDGVLGNAQNLLDKVVPYETRILAYKAQNQLMDAINTGLDLLSQLGEDFPRKATMAHVMVDLLKTKAQLRGKLRGKKIAQLADLPEMTEPRKIAAMRIIADIASSSYWATPALFPLLIFRMCKLSLRYGNTGLSAFGFSAYGVIMCGVLGAMKSGHEYGKLGIILLDKFDARAWLTQIYTPIYSLINNWNEHVSNTFGPLQESYHIGLETGAIEFACINSNLYCINAYLSGRPLEKIEAEARAYSESFARFKQETNVNYNEVYRQGMLNFMGQSKDPLILTGSAYDEKKMMAQNRERNDQTGKFFIHFNKLILCYFFHDYAQALEHARESRTLLEAVLAKFEIPNHHFYEALTLLALYPKAGRGEKFRMMARVQNNMLKLKKWAKYAPENYEHKYLLIKAERLRVLGRFSPARMVYDQAIQKASTHDYIHEEALAYELAGCFYLQQHSETQAEFHFKAAYNSYREWGAEAKLKHLRQLYPQMLSGTLAQSTDPRNTTLLATGSTMLSIDELDLITLYKASTAISGEIVLRNLLGVLMEIVIENAGARKGYLLLENEGELFIQTEYDLDQNKTTVLENKPFKGSQQLAHSVVQYVYRTQQSVVLADARNDQRFSQDDHIITYQPQSVLSLPIINQGKFIGILYLENNLNTGVFTQNLVEMLSILAGQIAVSLDNAILYENLEQKVQERTKELGQEKRKSDQLLLNILPLEIADELKKHGKAAPQGYSNVTIMFTDFTDFTRFSTQLSPGELVDEIATCFSAFDQIMHQHGVEKIKTIGDAYLCVGGLPIANSTHASDVVKAALDVQSWVKAHKRQRAAQGLPTFDVRIGLNSGPIVAGVVGTHKFAYDVWGKAVNTAARLEAGSEAGMINISSHTYELIKDQFDCRYRGKLPAKNMEDIDMYFVEGLRVKHAAMEGAHE